MWLAFYSRHLVYKGTYTMDQSVLGVMGQCALDLVLGGGYTKHCLDIHKHKSTTQNDPIGHLLVNPQLDRQRSLRSYFLNLDKSHECANVDWTWLTTWTTDSTQMLDGWRTSDLDSWRCCNCGAVVRGAWLEMSMVRGTDIGYRQRLLKV